MPPPRVNRFSKILPILEGAKESAAGNPLPAVPRLRYEQQDLQAAAEAAGALYEQRQHIPPVEVVWGRELPLRHFKARFRFRA